MIELTDVRTVERILDLVEGQGNHGERYMFFNSVRLYAPMEREDKTGFRPDDESPWLDFGWDCVTLSKKEHAHTRNLFKHWRYTEDNNGA